MADMVELLQAENRTLSQRASDFSEKVKALDQKVRRLDAQARAGVRAIEERDAFKAKLRQAEKAQSLPSAWSRRNAPLACTPRPNWRS